MIVTTAALYTLSYDPTEVSLETGHFRNLDHERIEPVEWIRFHKSLTASATTQRTVIMVNAAALPMFLDAIARRPMFG